MTTDGKQGAERSMVLAAGAMLLAAGTGGLGLAGQISPWVASMCAVCGGVVGAGSMVFGWLRRRAGLRRLEKSARSILAAPLGEAGDPGARDNTADVPSAMIPLGRAMDQLARRLESEGKQLAKNSRNLEALIGAMDEPLLATDNNRQVLLCNRSAEAVFDAGPGELVGRPINQVFTHAELLALHDAAAAGEIRRGRARITTATLGKRVYQVSASPVPMAWGEGVFGAVMLLRDVTELDQAVQVKTDFVANASHELRTPVAAIRTAAETLQAALADDPAMADRTAKMIVNHAGRLEELLRDLLDLSRLESPDVPLAIDTVDVDELARTLGVLFEAVCRDRGVRLVFDLDDELAGMRTDRKLLMLIMRNLVENAAKFAFEGTEIHISGSLVEARTDHNRNVTIGGVARFEVADRGIGIPIGQQDRVFERFYQVDPARSGNAGKRGTGLGLAIVKHAAKALAGRVGLKSVWGQGTTVWVEIEVGFAESGGAAARKAS